MSDSSESATQVTIFHRTYTIRGDDVDRVKRLAEIVDRKMSDVAQLTSTVDSAKIAILAALNIAEDYLSAVAKKDELEQALTEKSAHLISLLEPFIASGSLEQPRKS